MWSYVGGARILQLWKLGFNKTRVFLSINTLITVTRNKLLVADYHTDVYIGHVNFWVTNDEPETYNRLNLLFLRQYAFVAKLVTSVVLEMQMLQVKNLVRCIFFHVVHRSL